MSDERDQDDLDARRFRALAGNAHDVITEVDTRGIVVYRSPNHIAAEGRGAGQPAAHPGGASWRSEPLCAFPTGREPEHRLPWNRHVLFDELLSPLTRWD